MMMNLDKRGHQSYADSDSAADLYDSGGFDEAPPPTNTAGVPRSYTPPGGGGGFGGGGFGGGGSSYVQAAMNARQPMLETKNSHLLALNGPQQWQQDREVHNCNTCAVEFDFWHRKHHCRLCGLIFCDECTSHRAMMPLAWNEKDPQRVCSDCFFALRPIQEEMVETNANALRNNQIDEDGLWRYLNRPATFSIGGDIRKAAYSVQNLMDGVENMLLEDENLKADLLMDAECLLFLTTAKFAFIGGLKFGTGLVVNRLPGTEMGWSAPAAVGALGVSFGLMAGVDVTDVIVPMKAADAKAHFTKPFGMTLGGEAGWAVGLLGRSAAADAVTSGGGVSGTMSLSNSKGLYGGITLDGTVIKVRADINAKFYGKEHSVEHLLDGTVPPPPAAKALYDKLNEYRRVVLRRKEEAAAVVRREENAADFPPPPPQDPTDRGLGGSSVSNYPSYNAATSSNGYEPASGVAARAAYASYTGATPEQRQAVGAAAYGAGSALYAQATPAQRAQALGAAADATAAAASNDVFV